MDSASRAKKSGLGYATEKKMEDNYDRDEAAGIPAEIVNWINGVMEGVDGYVKLGEYKDWKTTNEDLRYGVVLCKLMNVLLKKDNQKEIQFSSKAKSPFQAMTNIENFNKGLIQYGLPSEASFQSGDLFELRKGAFFNVINAIGMLGTAANKKNVQPEYKGHILKTIDRE